MSGSNQSKRSETLTLSAFSAVALLGAMVLLYSLGVLNGRESERRKQTPAAYSQSAQADAERACGERQGRALFQCIYERVEASQEQARGEQDLSAQQRAASSALASAAIALLTLIISIVGVWFVKRTLDATLEAVEDTSLATDAMIRQNELAEDTANRQLRAYVGLNEVKLERVEPDKPISAVVEFINAGQTPARNVKIKLVFGVDQIPPVQVGAVLLRTKADSSAIILPGRTFKCPAISGVVDLPTLNAIANGQAAIYCVGVLAYEDTFGNPHESHFNLICGSGDNGFPDRFVVCSDGNSMT